MDALRQAIRFCRSMAKICVDSAMKRPLPFCEQHLTLSASDFTGNKCHITNEWLHILVRIQRSTPEYTRILRVFFFLTRDALQTPVSPLSPTEPEDSILKPKPLRQEARDMLTDLAFRKRSSPSFSSSANGSHSPSPGNPRRRRLQKTPPPDLSKTVVTDSEYEYIARVASVYF